MVKAISKNIGIDNGFVIGIGIGTGMKTGIDIYNYY